MNENKRTQRVTVRFSEEELKLVISRAKNKKNLSDYIRDACLYNKKKKQQEVDDVFIAVIGQELCTYIEEKYGFDEKIEGWCKKIWNHL